jgi:hypothetical protein
MAVVLIASAIMIMSKIRSSSQTPPKYLDKAVFEYAYAAIEEEHSRLGRPAKVDTCRGIYIRPGTTERLWKGSWVQHGATASAHQIP